MKTEQPPLELYRVTNVTVKPRLTAAGAPQTDLRTAAEAKGHAISFRGARGGAILLAPGESQVTNEITNSLRKLEQRGLVTIEDLNITAAVLPVPVVPVVEVTLEQASPPPAAKVAAKTPPAPKSVFAKKPFSVMAETPAPEAPALEVPVAEASKVVIESSNDDMI
ncbi:MAG: hypothetical protein MUP21_00100 [Dehalococcoidia bacterium]|nr:hypothetical protein [Dehalococcoidia bacterium]